MLFSLAIIVVFVLTSVYFYFRAEALERDIIKQKRSLKLAQKESTSLTDTFVIIGQKNADFAKHRLTAIEESLEALDEDVREAQESKIRTISPLINYYNVIFHDSINVKGRVMKVTKECFDGVSPRAFQEFVTFIKHGEQHLGRSWTSNSLTGFITLVESLLLDFEKTTKELVLAQENEESDIEREDELMVFSHRQRAS